MIETILNIKFCLALVFLIGLITGYQYIKALIKEDYSSILSKFNIGIRDNKLDIKNKESKIEGINLDISQMRIDIKSQKDSVNNVENSLRDVEHVYFKLSDTNNKLIRDIDDTQKILNSHKKEIRYYQSLLNKNLENDVISQNKDIEDNIENLNLSINQNSVKMYSLLEDETTKINNLENISIKISEKVENVENLRAKISNKTLELINKNKTFGLELEIDELNEKLVSYKRELASLKKQK